MWVRAEGGSINQEGALHDGHDRSMSNSTFSLSCRYTHTELSVHRMTD